MTQENLKGAQIVKEQGVHQFGFPMADASTSSAPNVEAKVELPLVRCNRNETALDAVKRTYNGCRLGVVHNAKPHEDEKLVAFLEVIKYSLRLPIFRQTGK